jgi:hypothetical protein
MQKTFQSRTISKKPLRKFFSKCVVMLSSLVAFSMPACKPDRPVERYKSPYAVLEETDRERLFEHCMIQCPEMILAKVTEIPLIERRYYCLEMDHCMFEGLRKIREKK